MRMREVTAIPTASEGGWWTVCPPTNAAAGPARGIGSPELRPGGRHRTGGKGADHQHPAGVHRNPRDQVWARRQRTRASARNSITFVPLRRWERGQPPHGSLYTLASRIADLLTGGGGKWNTPLRRTRRRPAAPLRCRGQEDPTPSGSEPVPDGSKGGQGEANDPDDASQGFTVRNEKVTQLTVTKVWHKVPAEEG